MLSFRTERQLAHVLNEIAESMGRLDMSVRSLALDLCLGFDAISNSTVRVINEYDLKEFLCKNNEFCPIEDLELLVSHYDSNGDGKLSKNDFTRIFSENPHRTGNYENSVKSLARCVVEESLELRRVEQEKIKLVKLPDYCCWDCFRTIDKSGIGRISLGHVILFIKAHGYQTSEKHIQGMFRAIDLDQDNQLSFKEFYHAITPKKNSLKESSGYHCTRSVSPLKNCTQLTSGRRDLKQKENIENLETVFSSNGSKVFSNFSTIHPVEMNYFPLFSTEKRTCLENDIFKTVEVRASGTLGRFGRRETQKYAREIEPRFDGRFGTRFGERFDTRFNERIDTRFDERFGPRLDDKFDTRFNERIDTRFNERFDTKFNDKFDTRFNERFDTKFDDKFDTRFNERFDTEFYERFDTRFDLKFDQRMTKNNSSKFGQNAQTRFEQTPEEKIEQGFERKTKPVSYQTSQQMHTQKSGEKLRQKTETKRDKKIKLKSALYKEFYPTIGCDDIIQMIKCHIRSSRELEEMKISVTRLVNFNVPELFKMIDTKNKGCIEISDIEQFFKSLRISYKESDISFLKRFDMMKFKDFQAMWLPRNSYYNSILAKRSNKKLKKAPFSELVTGRVKAMFELYLILEREADALKKLQKENLVEMFGRIDKKNNGYFTSEDLEIFLNESRVLFSAEDLESLMDRYDKDNDGKVTYSDFVQEFTLQK